MHEKLTFRSLTARPVLLKLDRPVVARIATIPQWPLILIDVETEEGVPGRAYLEPYVPKSMKYLVPALNDMSEMLAGQPLAPAEIYDKTAHWPRSNNLGHLSDKNRTNTAASKRM